MKINIPENPIYFEYTQYHNKLPEIFFFLKTQIETDKISINNHEYPIFLISKEIKKETLYKYQVDFSNLSLNEEDDIKLINSEYNFNIEKNSLRIFSLDTGSFEERSLFNVDNTKLIKIQNTQKLKSSTKNSKVLSAFTQIFKWHLCYQNIYSTLQLPIFIYNNGSSYVKKLKSFNLGQMIYQYFLLTQYDIDVNYILEDIFKIQNMKLRIACDFNQEINIKESLEITNNQLSKDIIYLSWHLIKYINEQVIIRLIKNDKEFIESSQKDFFHSSHFLTSNLGKKFIKFMHKYTQLYQALQNTKSWTLTLHIKQLIPVGTYVQIQDENYLVFESHYKMGANYLNKVVLKKLLTTLPSQIEIEDHKNTQMFESPSFSFANELLNIKYSLPKDINLKISSSDKYLNKPNIFKNIKLNLDIYENSEEKCELTHIQLKDNKVYFIFNNRFNKIASEEYGLYEKLIEINSDNIEQESPAKLQIEGHILYVYKTCPNLFKVSKL